jgi:hypothetical protein
MALIEEKQRSRYSTFFWTTLTVAGIILLPSVFGLLYLVVDLHKDMQSMNGVLTDRTTGLPMQTASTDLAVKNGVIISKKFDRSRADAPLSAADADFDSALLDPHQHLVILVGDGGVGVHRHPVPHNPQGGLGGAGVPHRQGLRRHPRARRPGDHGGRLLLRPGRLRPQRHGPVPGHRALRGAQRHEPRVRHGQGLHAPRGPRSAPSRPPHVLFLTALKRHLHPPTAYADQGQGMIGGAGGGGAACRAVPPPRSAKSRISMLHRQRSESDCDAQAACSTLAQASFPRLRRRPAGASDCASPRLIALLRF